MATPSQIQAFVSNYSSYAEQAAQATGLNAQLILAQWGNETNYGTEFAEKNNIGNVGVYGGGPNPSYGSIQEGVQAYIGEINSPAMASVKATAGQSIEAQAAALGASGYAGGHYNDGSGPGSSLLQDANTIAQDGSFGTAVAAGSASSNGDLENATPTSTAAPATTPAPPQSVTINGQTYTTPAGDANASTQTSALGQMSATLSSYGFTGSDLQTLVSWAWTEITGNVDPSQVAIDIQTPGSPVYPVFQKQFPGFTQANQSLTSQGLQAVSVDQYMSYQTQATAAAQAAGLPAGFLNKENIGILIGNNVSSAELTSRINDAVTLAYQSTPEQQQMFNQYFGTAYNQSISSSDPMAFGQGPNFAPTGHGPLTVGQIAALALDPNAAEPLIHQQIQAAQIGGASVTSGVGSIDVATAQKLAQAGITTSQATNAFQSLAPYSALETARPGMGGEAAQGTVSADQLAVGNLLGDPAAQRQLQQAVEVAKAPFSGGGGFVQSSKGAVGTGSASSSGAGNT